MTKRTELSLNVPRSNQRWHRTRKAGTAERVFAALIADPCRLDHPSEVTFERRRDGKRCVPRLLIIVFSKHCVDQLQTDVFSRAQPVVRKEQGDDAAEDQSCDALAAGDVHQIQDYEGTATEERAAEQKVQRPFGANFVKVPW